MAFDSLSQLGPYYLIRRVTEQSYYATFESTHPSSGERVLVTAFAKEFTEQPDFETRFVTDYTKLQKIASPHVARCFGGGIDETTGLPFVATEFVKGVTFAEMLQGNMLPGMPDVCEYIAQAAEGLKAMQKEGCLHRDLRPASLQLADDGTVKIVNLGRGALLPSDSFRLGHSMIVGSPLYIAPEQVMGQNGDHRADLYSLGAVAFHLLGGQPVFSGNSPDELFKQHTSTPAPSLVQTNPAVPLPFSELISDTLLKDAGARYADYDTFLIDWRGMMRTTPFDDASGAAPAAAPGVAPGAAAMAGGAPGVAAGSESFSLGGGVTDLEQIMPSSGGGGGIATASGGSLGSQGMAAEGLRRRGVDDRVNHGSDGPGVGKIVFLVLLLGGLGYGAFALYELGWDGVVAKIVGGPGPAEADEGEMLAIEAYENTELILEQLAARVQIIAAQTGKTPSVEDLLAAGVAEDAVTDGYGMLMRIDKFGKMIMSNGPDGKKGTTDDFIWDWDRGRMTQKPRKPKDDETLEESLYTTRRPGER